MASFTDNLVAFNPYVQEVPVDDYVRVGMIKQEQYNKGVQQVQSYIDSIAGIEALMPEQKDYINQRVSNLQQEVGKVVQGDFSQQQLVNSVGALTSRIAADPIVKATIASTDNYRAGIAAVKDAKAKGKSSISNEWDFEDQFQKWYNSGDAASRFSGTFTPYTDVTSKISKIIKDLDPNSHIEDIPFRRGGDGQIEIGKDGQPIIDWAMKHIESKSLTPERITAAISANLTQDDINQLRIDGRYSYRGMDAQGMKDATDRSYEYKLGQTNDIIQSLMIARQGVNNNPKKAAEIDSQIQAYKEKAQAYQNSYKQDIATINSNLDGYKASMYTTGWLSKFGDSYAYAQQSLTYKENPYFMAAERRRENDIKFEEFKANNVLNWAKYDLDKDRLGLDREKLEAYKLSLSLRGSKKTAKGALDGIELEDPVLEPIAQAELDQVNVNNFMKETEEASNSLDQQKMALLGNTGLVTIKRDPDGKNPRYEYNVAGKDPQTVISAAEAAVEKLKSDWEKDPNSVDDGTRTYFSNQANIDQTVQNRKFAVGNIERNAEREGWSTKAITDKINPLDVTTVEGKRYVMTGEEQYNFNKKLSSIQFNAPGYGGPGQHSFYDDKAAQTTFTTPAEKYMYDIMRRYQNGAKMTNNEIKIISKLGNVELKANIPNIGIQRGKNEYMNNAIKEIATVQQPVSFSLDAFEAPDRKRAQNVAANILSTIVRDGKSNPNPQFDKSVASDMLGKNSENTTYSLVSNGRNKYALRLNNSIVGKSTEIDISRQQAEELFGQGKFLDDFYNIRQSLQLTRGTGKWTTDVRNLGRDGAFNLENGQLNRYSVKYHVEEPLKNGGLQVRMYIYDKLGGDKDPTTGNPTGAWLPERTAGFGQLLNEAQVTKFLSVANDQYIDSILKKDK